MLQTNYKKSKSHKNNYQKQKKALDILFSLEIKDNINISKEELIMQGTK